MSWQADWESLSSRIAALAGASERVFGVVNVTPDMFKPVIEHVLFPQALDAFAGLRRFSDDWRGQLPVGASNALDDLIRRSSIDDIWQTKHKETAVGWRTRAARATALLGIIRGEVQHLLADPALHAIGVTERAVKHLQWMIVSDEEVAAKWQAAFDDEGEPRCERMGGTHLLLHGIWAYKAHSPTQRTDLVLGDPIEDKPEVRRAARALVLTEWKRIPSPTSGTIAAAARQGRHQARVYAGEVLAGFDLRAVRYVILVTPDRIVVPGDEPEGNVVYRYLNVAVRPQPASDRVPSPRRSDG